MTASTLEPVAGLDEVRADLDRLASASGNVFGTWEFLSTWWRHFGAGRPLRVLASDDAIVPLYVWRSLPLRVLRFVGHGAGDELGPVGLPEGRERAGRALLERPKGWDVVVGEQLPAGDEWTQRGRVLVSEGSPLLHLEPGTSWDELMAGWSAKLRRDLRADERRLERDHGLVFRLSDDPERLDRDLDLLFELHEARWAGSDFARRREFHRDFARLAHERGWLRLWFLELEGTPAAVWYGFRFGRIDSHYQVGRDLSWRRFGTGTLLTGHTIRNALADGQLEYRFLRGGEDYKYRFAREDPGLRTVGFARGPLGRAAVAAVAAARRAR